MPIKKSSHIHYFYCNINPLSYPVPGPVMTRLSKHAGGYVFGRDAMLFFFVLGINNQPISRMDRLIYAHTVPDNKRDQGHIELLGNRG